MAWDIILAVLAFTSALFGVLTLNAVDESESRWFRKSFLAKLLALNSFLVLIVCIPKIYTDNSEKAENQSMISGLQVNLNTSLKEQMNLQQQLAKAKDELKGSIEYAAQLEVEYQKSKELESFKKWQSAFLAERNINKELLQYLANELESKSTFYFLKKPSYLRNNYLQSVMRSPSISNQYQLELLTLLHDEINEINNRIKAGSDALLPGNNTDSLSGIDRFVGVERHAKRAIELYELLELEL